MENLTKAVEFKENCDEETRELFQEISEMPYHKPPTLFKFAVGEHPRLPVFGRHFRNCTSKISCDQGRAEPVLEQIFEILKEYFPTNIAYWSEVYEERMEELMESGVYKLDPNPSISKEIFYEEMKELCSTNIDDKGQFLEARERFVNVLNYCGKK